MRNRLSANISSAEVQLNACATYAFGGRDREECLDDDAFSLGAPNDFTSERTAPLPADIITIIQ